MATFFQDIDWSFGLHPGTHDVLRQSDVQAVRTSLKNLFQTEQGENVDDPFYGIGIRQLQFELFSPVLKSFIIRKVKDQVSRYIPECVIENINVTHDEMNNDIIIVVFFYATGKYEVQKFSYTVERTR